MGSGSSVYQCEVKMDSLNSTSWKALSTLVGGKISSLTELLSGKFPVELEAVLTDQKGGLFPAPRQFHPYCSCPDHARFCKHLAAVIYGVGNRLDTQPELLFTLRGVSPSELVSKAITKEKDSLVAKAQKVKSTRLLKLKDSELSKMFHIDFAKPRNKK